MSSNGPSVWTCFVIQVKEIGAANLKPNEEDDLTSERDRLAHFQQINNALQQAVATFNEERPPFLTRSLP